MVLDLSLDTLKGRSYMMQSQIRHIYKVLHSYQLTDIFCLLHPSVRNWEGNSFLHYIKHIPGLIFFDRTSNAVFGSRRLCRYNDYAWSCPQKMPLLYWVIKYRRNTQEVKLINFTVSSLWVRDHESCPITTCLCALHYRIHARSG